MSESAPPEDTTLTPTPPPEEVKAGRKLKVIGKQPLAQVIDLAVSRALRRKLRKYDPAQVASVQKLVREEFLQLLEGNARSVRGVSKAAFMVELERSRDNIIRSRNEARVELKELRRKMNAFVGLQEMDDAIEERGARSFDEVHRHVIADKMRDLFDLAARGEISQEELNEQLLGLASRSVEEDRQRIRNERTAEYDRQSENFERRISKLRGALERSELALAELAKRKDIDSGIASIYRNVQGLSLEEEDHRAKEVILEQLFRANLLLQQKSA